MGKRAQIKRQLQQEAAERDRAQLLERQKLQRERYVKPAKRIGISAAIFIIIIVAGLWIESPSGKALWKRITTPQEHIQQEALHTKATIETAKGAIELELYPKLAPKTVENFQLLAQRGYYTNLTFHRVEPGFVIQGGDPKGDSTGGESAWGGKFKDEIKLDDALYKNGYKESIVAMANRGPNSNGSQFFIMLADNNDLPKSYTIFGKVTAGMDVVKRIVKGDKMTSVTTS